jgi:hypothetical protein
MPFNVGWKGRGRVCVCVCIVNFCTAAFVACTGHLPCPDIAVERALPLHPTVVGMEWSSRPTV